MERVLERELTSVIQGLPPRDIWLVVGYAKTLQTHPGIGQSGRAYRDMLALDGASTAEIARAALAVREVEERYARLGPEAATYDLERRTEAHMRVWLKERGLDYDTITDEQVEQIADEAVQRTRRAAKLLKQGDYPAIAEHPERSPLVFAGGVEGCGAVVA